MTTELLVQLFMLLAGMLAHFLKKVIEERRAGRLVTLKAYWLANPYATAFSVLGAVAGFVALAGTAELTKLTAFGLGYACDSAASMVGERGAKKLQAH